MEFAPKKIVNNYSSHDDELNTEIKVTRSCMQTEFHFSFIYYWEERRLKSRNELNMRLFWLNFIVAWLFIGFFAGMYCIYSNFSTLNRMSCKWVFFLSFRFYSIQCSSIIFPTIHFKDIKWSHNGCLYLLYFTFNFRFICLFSEFSPFFLFSMCLRGISNQKLLICQRSSLRK